MNALQFFVFASVPTASSNFGVQLIILCEPYRSFNLRKIFQISKQIEIEDSDCIKTSAWNVSIDLKQKFKKIKLFRKLKKRKLEKNSYKMGEFCEFKEPKPFTATEQQAIDQLKQMFKQNTDINFQTDNYFLTKFLRYRDWNVQATYESIKNYYKIKVSKLWNKLLWHCKKKYQHIFRLRFHFIAR